MSVTYSELGNNGRLGNCLFQCAASIASAIRHGDSYLFPDNWPDRIHFNIPDDKFTKNKIVSHNVCEEPYFHYSPIVYRPSLNIKGYRQSEKYFKDVESEIRKLFTFKEEILEQTGVASIHVRRGDYTWQYYTDLGNSDYYERAMNIVNTDKYFVFSDDIEWCKRRFVGNKFVFIEGGNATSDMNLLSKCENNIIANSSFSWWGAYLNNNVNKKVIAPRNWFGPKLQHDTKDLIPAEWKII